MSDQRLAFNTWFNAAYPDREDRQKEFRMTSVADLMFAAYQAGIAQPRAQISDDLVDAVSKALRRAWQLGQTYWQQADSESYSQNRKSDETQRKFEQLIDETRALLAAQGDAPSDKDSERYRWLRARLSAADFYYGDPPHPVLVFDWPSNVGVGGNCDMNIDAAIAASTPNNET